MIRAIPASWCAALAVVAAAVPAPAQISFLGAQSAALGGATVAFEEDKLGRANPAARARVRKALLAFHGTGLYGIPELRLGAAVVAVPIGRVAAAVGMSTFGFDLYRETTLESGLAAGFGAGSHRRMSVGVAARRYSVRIERYGGRSAWAFTAGIQLPVTPHITLGTTFHDVVVRGGMAPDRPRRLDLGFAFKPEGAFAVVAAVGKELRSPLTVGAGIELFPVAAIGFRLGATSNPPQITGGTGLRAGPIGADLAAVHHRALGWTPSITVQISW